MKTNLQLKLIVSFLSYGMGVYASLCPNTNSLLNSIKPTEEPNIVVKGNLIVIANGDGSPSFSDNTLFPSTHVVGDSKAVTYSIANEGAMSFDVAEVRISGTNYSDFSVVTTPATTVLSGTQTYFSISFNPSEGGMRNAIVEVVLGQPSNLVYTFAIQGVGLNYTACNYNTASELIKKQDFELSPSTPVWNFSVTSGTASVTNGLAYAEYTEPASTTTTTTGDYSLQVNNSSAVINFSSVNTTNLKEVTFYATLGSYATTPAGGLDDDDAVTVSISTNGGLSWSDEIKVTGNDNAKWSLLSGEAIANSTYVGAGVAATYAPTAGGYRYSDGYATIALSGLPSVSDLRIRLTITTNDATEIWAVDDVSLYAKTQIKTEWDGADWSAGAPNDSMKAILNGNYNTSLNGNIEANNVQINPEVIVTVTANHAMNSQTDVVNMGSLVIESDGVLKQVDDYAVNTGAIEVQRTAQPMRRYDFTYWSSPVGNQTLHDLSPVTQQDKYYSFNAENGNWQQHLNGSIEMEKGKGYIVRAPQDFDLSVPAVFSARFFGTINNGIVSVPVAIQNGQSYGWNLIGNPYPSAIRIDDFLSLPENENLFEQTVYLWTHNSELNSTTGYQYLADDYAAYNFTGGISARPSGATSLNSVTPSGNIASGQSFFIKAKANGTAVFNNSVRSISYNNEFYRTTNAAAVGGYIEKNRIWLNIQNDKGAFKQTLLGYVTGATNDYDSKYDGVNLNGNSYMNFYSINNATNYSIQGRSLPFNTNDQIPMGYYCSMAGIYQISIDHVDGIFVGHDVSVYLEDQLLGVVQNLKLSPYKFNSESGTFNNRFVLRYTESALTSTQFATDNGVTVAVQSNKLMVQSLNNAVQQIVVNDILGKELYRQTNINQEVFETTKITASQQIIIVTVLCSDGTKVFKKVKL